MPDPFVITRALALFQRSILSGDSPWDRYHRGEPLNGLSTAAGRGMALFYSARTHCAGCHGGFNFTDFSFRNNGLYAHYAEPGRARATGNAADSALFKVPSLRNVAVTAPYMHDGSIKTLEEVVAHYNNGGAGHAHQHAYVRPLGLSVEEQADLVAFLQALTDPVFLDNKLLRE
jgi:cytochrome c peroxidase